MTAVASPTAVVAITDASSRERACVMLRGMRWIAQPAQGGADSLAQMQSTHCDAILVDSWLPDLEIREFLSECGRRHPEVDIVMLDATDAEPCDAGSEKPKSRNPRRNELLHVLRLVTGDCSLPSEESQASKAASRPALSTPPGARFELKEAAVTGMTAAGSSDRSRTVPSGSVTTTRIPELLGDGPAMQELARRIRLLAPRKTTVLIEGATGTGKELVARALHRLSARSQQPMRVINCAAIPEALLEAELFGHTRGAFTGAVTARTGRIDSAHGGTLFLDEIGEMPLALQAKLLRFLESGELQRIGDNATIQVDVRVIAATNQRLAAMVREGKFRADLMYRLAVFPLRMPSLGERKEDIPLLAEHFLGVLGEQGPARKLPAKVLEVLKTHSWPGNVRELQHVMERAYILAGDNAEIAVVDIELDASAEAA
jgi:DNA-binding NtrC family response regulator